MVRPVDGHEIMDATGKRQTEYDATAPRVGLAPDVAALSIGGQAPMDEILIDLDILTWALERVGDGEGGCEFEPMNQGDPDHHGPEFAKELFDAIKAERAEYDLLRGANK